MFGVGMKASATRERQERVDGVELMEFSSRIEAAPPEELNRDEAMSSSATAPVSHSEETHYYRIGEVSRLTELKPFVLRYWETEFPMLEPVKGANGHRLYRQEDVDLVLQIKRLLYDEGFTIAGARRHLKELASGSEGGERVHGGEATTQLNRKMLLDLRDGLRSFLTLLESK
jgi:DNA-binding transcriptional MerR regulator